MRRKTVFAAVMFTALPLAGASAQYVELGAAARHQMMVEVQTTPGAAEAARPWISDEQRVQLVGTQQQQRRRPRFSFTPPRD